MTATDGSRSSIQEEQIIVEIYVSDLNDNHPIFEKQLYELHIYRTPPLNSSLLDIKAFDADIMNNGEVSYHFHTDFNNLPFTINSDTGTIKMSSPLFTKNVFHLIVIASDKGTPNLKSQCILVLHIDITNYVETKLKFQKSKYSITIDENFFSEADIIQVMVIEYKDTNQNISYSIGSGNELNIFQINSSSGRIKTSNATLLHFRLCNKIHCSIKDPSVEYRNIGEQANNFLRNKVSNEDERKSNFSLIVIAQSNELENLKAYTEIIIKILDVNNNAPVFTQAEYFSVILEGSPKHYCLIKVIRNILRISKHAYFEKINIRLIISQNLRNAIT